MHAMRRGLLIPVLTLGLCAAAGAQVPGLRCTVQGTSLLQFGSYNPLLFSDQLAQGSFTVRCVGNPNRTTPIQIGIGAGSVGTVSARTMSAGIGRLRYGLYQDSGRSVPWGDGTDGTSVLVRNVSGGDQFTLPLYGRIAQRQNVPIGAYSDLVTIQINY